MFFFVPYTTCVYPSLSLPGILYLYYMIFHIFFIMPIQPFISPLKYPSFLHQFTFFSSLVPQKNTFGTRCSPFHHLPYQTTLNSILLAFKRPIRAEKNMRSKIIVRIRHSVYKKAVQKITFLLHFLLFFLSLLYATRTFRFLKKK